MASPWPPARDADLRAAATTFAQTLAADPPSFGVDTSLAAEVVAAAGDFQSKLLEAVATGTNSSAAVSRKNESRRALLAAMRRAAGFVRAHVGDDEPRLRLLGMVVPHRIKTRIPQPATRPGVSVCRIDRLAHELRVSSTDNPFRRALPAGCTGYAIFRKVQQPRRSGHADGGNGQIPPPGFRFEGVGTRPTFRLSYAVDDAGKESTIFVRYLNRKGELGPPSAPVTCLIAA